nr:MAG TPA: hypothetical protein [Caudoviricetes sp.]
MPTKLWAFLLRFLGRFSVCPPPNFTIYSQLLIKPLIYGDFCLKLHI